MNGAVPWLHLQLGQTVHRLDDERHTGRIEAIHHSTLVKVRWHDTGWISFEEARDLCRQRLT